MKYILTEGQIQLLNESGLISFVKRRISPEYLKKFVSNGEINFPTLCDDFEDEFEYADNVIEWAVDDLFSEYGEDEYEDPEYNNIRDYITNYMRDEYGEYLFDIYRNTCGDEENLDWP